MRNTWKKAADFAMALALVAGAAPAMNYNGGLLGRSGIVASAAEESETINTDAGSGDNNVTYTGTHFKIDATYDHDSDGFYASNSEYAIVSALDGKQITKLELIKGYGNFDPTVDSETAEMSVSGNTYTFTNINATSVKIASDGYCQIKQVTIYYEGAEATDISTATVNLASDNSVSSITVGDDTITDLSGFDITYGTDDSHTATSVPTDAGTYYAYVTAKDTNTSYTGTAKSASFEVTSFDAFNASTETNPTLTFTEDFTGNVNITRDDGVIDLNGHTINGNLMIQNNAPDKTVTIKNGTVTGELDSLAAWNDFFKGKVVLENLTVSGIIWTDGHDYTIKSGTYNGVIYALKNDETTGITTITGGTFNNRLITGFGNPVVGGGTFNVSGGTFTYRPLAESMAEGYNTRWNNGSYVVTTDELNEVTSKITNPSFENGTTGWDITASEDTGSRDTNNNIYWMTGSSGNNLFNTYPAGKISQTVTGLENGKYKLEVVAASTENFKVAVSANNVTSEITAAGDHNGIFNTIEFNVTDGTANISAEGLNNVWFKVDDFRLFYVAPKFTSASVTLSDDLALNFYFDGIADDTAAAEYTVNFTGACVDESSALTYNAAVGKYYATTHVYAKDIDKDITATLCKGSDTIDTLEDYSITQYLSSPAFSEADEKTTALLTATQNFGNASAEYFYDDNYGVTATFEDYDPDVSAYATTFGSDDALLTLVLDSKTAARLYVKGDTTGTDSTINATKAEYPTYHEITELLPQNLADEQTITVGGTDYKFSALSWCNRVLTNGSASQKNINMAKAIMAYYQAAKNYTAAENPVPAATPVTAITLNKTATTISAGQTETLSVSSVTPDDATDKTVTWSSDNEAVATVNATTGEVTAVAAGTANITATANDGSGVTATCAVTVTPATITVTWNNDDITGTSAYGTSFTKDGVTITADEIYFPYKNFMNGGTFTTTLGNFTKIEVTTGIWDASGAGWIGSTWTGNASSVSFSDSIVGNGMGNTKFVFTIAPTN
ncbi:Ig-like domain-containing protein [Ruminococcus sp.]|uniref:Ig-like domain-containing protein n=1 Tax=Ruminococcus sp. TaxID=41978 RepID=UPI0025FEC4DC|nr:Ig-like domain-containing protein [Ruminococcus sp.]